MMKYKNNIIYTAITIIICFLVILFTEKTHLMIIYCLAFLFNSYLLKHANDLSVSQKGLYFGVTRNELNKRISKLYLHSIIVTFIISLIVLIIDLIIYGFDINITNLCFFYISGVSIFTSVLYLFIIENKKYKISYVISFMLCLLTGILSYYFKVQLVGIGILITIVILLNIVRSLIILKN